jgi:hypothetical protein
LIALREVEALFVVEAGPLRCASGTPDLILMPDCFELLVLGQTIPSLVGARHDEGRTGCYFVIAFHLNRSREERANVAARSCALS